MCTLPAGSKSTQMSFRPSFLIPFNKSSKETLQLATKSSGGIEASWKTVSVRFSASETVWVKVSPQDGLKVLDFVDDR